MKPINNNNKLSPFPTTSMNRSVPTIYRSLPIVQSSSTLATRDHMVQQQLKETTATVGKTNTTGTTVKIPRAEFESLITNKIFCLPMEKLNLQETQKQLGLECETCEFQQTSTLCEFICVAQAKDGKERCKFSISLWEVQSSQNAEKTNCVFQLDRLQGCPFYLKQVVARIVSKHIATAPQPKEEMKKCKLFRAPKLPENFLENDCGVDVASVENAIKLATCNQQEQRVQGAAILADLCCESPNFASVFRSINGLEKIAVLKQDSNPYIQQAISRILAAA